MHSKTWKNFELQTARELGSERELFAGSGGDVKHSIFLVDCKNRSRWSVSAWFQKLRADADKRNKIPLLVLKEPKKHLKLAVVELHVLTSLCKAAGWGPEVEITEELQAAIIKKAKKSGVNGFIMQLPEGIIDQEL